MSDSHKNAQDDEVSSADSASSEYEEEEEPESESLSESVQSDADSGDSSDSDGDGSRSEEEGSSEDDPSENDNDHSSDSDFVPGKKSRKKKKPKKAAKKKPTKKAVTRSRPQRTRRRHESEEASSDEDSGSDGEFRPPGSRRRRASKKTAKSSKSVSAPSRRSTRNLGRKQVKYDDRSIYGEVEGLYEDDGKEKEAKRKEYRNVAKKRKRGGIKKLVATPKVKSRGRGSGSPSKSTSNSLSPRSKKRLKLTHKAYSEKKGKDVSSEDEEEDVGMAQSGGSPKKPLFTYTSWLDEVVSDTECKYSSRGRLMQCKVNHVKYHIQVQTAVGIEDFNPEDGKIRASSKTRDDVNTESGNAMEVDGDADSKPTADDKDGDGDSGQRPWFQKVKVGDYVQCLAVNEEGAESWCDCKVHFINRGFHVQYVIRRSISEETIWEFKEGTEIPNPELRARLRPSGVEIDATPEPESVTVSPIRKRKSSAKKKKNRFGDSDESESESQSEDEDSDLNVSGLTTQSHSVSPVDDLVTKIENILFKLELPKSTVHWRDTFKHLMPKGDQSGSGKMEVDGVDEEDKENSGDQPNASSTTSTATTPAVTEKMQTKYLVKYVNKSYHHLEWLTSRQLDELEGERKRDNFDKKWSVHDRIVKQVHTAMSMQKYHTASGYFFNDLYLEIDRIISYAEPGQPFDSVAGLGNTKTFQINDNTSEETMYLVKWKGMEYDEATWEMESFLKDDDFDAQYHGRREIKLLLKRQKIPEGRLLHPSPKRLNTSLFVNRSATEHRVKDGEVFKGGRMLRGNYQRDGVNWMLNNWQGRRGCILADEMGLGKTVQTVTFINYLFEHYRQWGPFLVVAPLSTLGHWQREFRAWSDMNVIVYHGSQSSRERIQMEEFDWLWTDDTHTRARTEKNLKDLNANNFKFNVMITTPQTVNSDRSVLDASKINWNTIIVDEAHSLKSNQSLFYRVLRTYKNPHTHCCFLTGTPIQNNMQELWCLLHFLDPDHFHDQDSFVEKYANLAESRDELKEVLKGRLLQRLKYLVEKSLGHREEKIIWVELTLFQKKWYKALYQRSYEKLNACGAKGKVSMMNVAMQLRKCCNHPFLMQDVERTISPAGTDEVTMNENLIKSCGKFVLLDKLLPKLQREGHRVLIFSQMSHLLDIVEDYLSYRQHLYERIDGGVTGVARQEAIDRFQKDDSIFAFLLTTKAGGVGITLTGADTVIIYDSDWNPMNDVQAIARSHRIGQTKQVTVYRLLTRNSYEENMFKRADQKLALNKAVMGDSKDLKKEDLDVMLKKGAISMFLQDAQTDADIKKFADASIDDILSKRTEVITHDADTANPDNAMFSEAVFLAHADDADVNVDDENFWEALGIQPKEEEQAYSLSPFRRRRRTRISTRNTDSVDCYDSDDEYMGGTVDQGTTLLGALNYIVYGRWQQIYDDLTAEEKTTLGIEHKEDDTATSSKMEEDDNSNSNTNTNANSNESNTNNSNDDKSENLDTILHDGAKEKGSTKMKADEKSEEDYVPPPTAERSEGGASQESTHRAIEQWQIDILRQAAVETICRMINLLKPEMREQKLGKDLKKMESVMHNREFRRDCIYTIARQIYRTEIDAHGDAGWKQVVSRMWQERDLKNRFVDTKQLKGLPNRCKMGCGRVRNPDQRPDTDEPYKTCCENCGRQNDLTVDNEDESKSKSKSSSKPKFVHEARCDRRHHRELIGHIRDEAVKTFLKKHPLTRMPVDPQMEEKAESVDPHNVRYALPARIESELIAAIEEEVKYHSPLTLALATKVTYIDATAVKMELAQKTHGDIIEVLETLERIFKFKTMYELAGSDVTSMQLDSYSATKSFPEWWSSKWTECLVAGTYAHGWCNVPPEYARDAYAFTGQWKGPSTKWQKAQRKLEAEKKKLEAVQQAMGNVQIETDGTASAQNKATSPSAKDSKTASPSPPELVVRKREWPEEGSKQLVLIRSICNHKPLKKSVADSVKAVIKEIKNLNSEREAKVNGRERTLAAELKAIEKAKKEAERERKRKEKESKRARKEAKREEERQRKLKKAINLSGANDITNYFSAALKNMPAGTRNAFEVLGKKKLSEEEMKKKKKRKRKQEKKEKKEARKRKREEELKLPIEFDQHGNFKTPIKFGKVAIIKSLGTISLEDGYHGLGNIYPIGYTACHGNLPSIKRPGQVAVFTTTIERGVNGPVFVIKCSDDPEFKLTAKNASNVWAQLNGIWQDLKEGAAEHDQRMADAVLNHKSPEKPKASSVGTSSPGDKSSTSSPRRKNKMSGPRKIGLSHPDIRRVIECMPKASKCTNYRFVYRTRFNEKEDWTPKRCFDRTFEAEEKKRSKKKKRSKSKSPKKSKKAKKGMGSPTVINNINNVNQICIVNNITTTHPMVHPMSSPMGSGAGHQPHPMSSASDGKKDVIVIEDSPSQSVGAQRVSPSKVEGDDAVSDTESKDAKKSRKRKHPSLEENALSDGDLPTKKRKISG